MLYHREADGAILVDQLAANRLGKAFNGMFAGAVGALQRNRAEGQRRTDLDDRASVARPHLLQRAAGAVDGAQKGHFHDMAELVRRHLFKGAVHRHHRVVDPKIGRPELAFCGGGGGLDLVEVADVGGDGNRPSAKLLNFPLGRFEAIASPREQGDFRARSASSRAVARPTPPEAPVITTTLFSSTSHDPIDSLYGGSEWFRPRQIPRASIRRPLVAAPASSAAFAMPRRVSRWRADTIAASGTLPGQRARRPACKLQHLGDVQGGPFRLLLDLFLATETVGDYDFIRAPRWRTSGSSTRSPAATPTS